MKKYYKFMDIIWSVKADSRTFASMERLLKDYFEEIDETKKVDFKVCLEYEKYKDLDEILEFGEPTVIHNSKKSAVHEKGIEYRNGMLTSIYNCSTKSVYVMNYLSNTILIYNSDKGIIYKDGIRVIRDIVKVLAEKKNAIMIHAAALYKEEYGGIILVGGKGSGKTSISLELLYKHGFSEVSRDRIMLLEDNGNYTIYGWPNYYNLTIRTMYSYIESRKKIPEQYQDLSEREMDLVNKKIQFTAEEIGIKNREKKAPLKHIFYLNNHNKGMNLSKEELLAISCYTPDDLNYPNWHRWEKIERDQAFKIAKDLMNNNSTIITWSSLQEAIDVILQKCNKMSE